MVARLDEEVIVWGRTFRKAYGTKAAAPTLSDDENDDDQGDVDPYADADEKMVED